MGSFVALGIVCLLDQRKAMVTIFAGMKTEKEGKDDKLVERANIKSDPKIRQPWMGQRVDAELNVVVSLTA